MVNIEIEFISRAYIDIPMVILVVKAIFFFSVVTCVVILAMYIYNISSNVTASKLVPIRVLQIATATIDTATLTRSLMIAAIRIRIRTMN